MGSASRHPGSGPPNRPNVPARRDFSDRAHACPAVPGVGVDEDVTRCGHSDAVMQRCAAARLRALRDARPGHPRRMGHSAVRHLFDFPWVPVAHDRDLGRGAVELCEIVAGELNGAGAKVLPGGAASSSRGSVLPTAAGRGARPVRAERVWHLSSHLRSGAGRRAPGSPCAPRP